MKIYDLNSRSRCRRIYGKNVVAYPEMPVAIGDYIYHVQKRTESGGHIGYEIMKAKCEGYFNFGNGWKIRLKRRRNNYKYCTYDIEVSAYGYVAFGTKKEAEEHIKDLDGFIVKGEAK